MMKLHGKRHWMSSSSPRVWGAYLVPIHTWDEHTGWRLTLGIGRLQYLITIRKGK